MPSSFLTFMMELTRSSAFSALGLAVLLFAVGGFKEPLRSKFQAFFIAAAVVLSFASSVTHLQFPTRSPSESLCLVAALLFLFVVIQPKGLNSRYLVRAIFVGLTGAVMLWQIREQLHGPVHLRNMIAFFCLGLGIWSITEKATRSVQLPTLLALPTVCMASLSLLLLFKGSGTFSFTAAVVAMLMGAVLAVSLVAQNKISELAVIPYFSVFVVALLAAAHFFLHINPWVLIYLCIPYLLLWIRAWIPLIPSRGAWEALVLSFIAVIPLGYLLFNSYLHHG